MTDIDSLAQQAHHLGVLWNKANNFYCSFATVFFETKKRFDAGEFPGWTFTMWLGQKARLVESQCLAQLKNFDNVIAAPEREATATRKRQLDAERRKENLAKLEERKLKMEQAERIKAEIAFKKEQEANLRKAKLAERKETMRKAKKAESDKAYRERRKATAPLPASSNNFDLAQLAKEIRAALESCKSSRETWIASTIKLAAMLRQAREQHPSNKAFGDWLLKNDISLNENDTTALVHFGYEPDIKTILEQGESLSWQMIWRKLKKESKVIPMG